MKTALEMQEMVARLAKKHDFDLNQFDCSLVLHLDGFMPLVVERIAPNQISLCHYYKQNGDMMRDPEVVFFTGYTQWVPLTFEQSPGVYQVTATVTDDNTAIETIAPGPQADLARFCRTWARNLQQQGWLEHSRQTTLVSIN